MKKAAVTINVATFPRLRRRKMSERTVRKGTISTPEKPATDELVPMKWPSSIPLAVDAARINRGARARDTCGSSVVACDSSAAEMNYRFDVMSLREHIKRDDGINTISARPSLTKIARPPGARARHATN